MTVREWVGRPFYEQQAQRTIDAGALEAIASASVLPGDAATPTTGVGAPLAAWSVLMRSCAEPNPLQLHFDLKAELGYPHALITEHRVVADSGPAIGGRYRHRQVLRSIGIEAERSVGVGRSWRIDVEYLDAGGTVVALESYESFGYRRPEAETSNGSTPETRVEPAADNTPRRGRWATSPFGAARTQDAPLADERARTILIDREWVRAGSSALGVDVAVHHDPDAARAAGVSDILVSTPHLGALVERFVLDRWGARVRDLRIEMRRPVVAGTEVTVAGVATHGGWSVAFAAHDRLLAAAVCS